MKERRKRRSAKDIKESIINAATHLIETEGFSNLTVQFSFIGQVRPYRGVRELVHVSSGIGIFSAGGVNQRGQACRNGMHVILFDRSRFAVYPPVAVRQVLVELLQPFPTRRPVTENKYTP